MHVKRTISKQKQNQVMSHLNRPRALLFDLAQKQCTGIIKGWLHCLMSEPKGRFLVNNILMLAGHCLNPIFFNKKNKDWTSKILAKPPPLYVEYISFFCLNCCSLSLPPSSPPPPKWTSYVYHHLS